jgi:hypothetical protein
VIRWWRRLRLRRRMRQLAIVLRRIEATQAALKMPKWQRDQMWRDFKYGPRGREWVIQILRGAGK